MLEEAGASTTASARTVDGAFARSSSMAGGGGLGHYLQGMLPRAVLPKEQLPSCVFYPSSSSAAAAAPSHGLFYVPFSAKGLSLDEQHRH